jgi:hypothetical protein
MLKKWLRILVVICMMGAFFTVLAGCEKKEGTFEKTGKKMDESLEKAKDKAGDIEKQVEKKADDLKKSMKE